MVKYERVDIVAVEQGKVLGWPKSSFRIFHKM